jgi:hypothetical protein
MTDPYIESTPPDGPRRNPLRISIRRIEGQWAVTSDDTHARYDAWSDLLEDLTRIKDETIEDRTERLERFRASAKEPEK